MAQQAGALTGLMLDQKYRLESILGVGGTGTVYRAQRLLIGDSAAVKVLHPNQTGHPKAVERFRREAQIAARLKHENVVNVYDFGVSKDGLVYFVMEMAQGVSLRQMIVQQGKFTEAEAAQIISQVCAAMDDAHRQGVVHRDLKPENILVHATPQGLQVKVLDFGISTQREIFDHKLTQTGGVIGTPHYMSPEQCKGEELDGRSDIYSLGIVLFEMLTGFVPFNSKTPTAIVVQQVNQAPPPLREINPEISPAIEAVVLRALAKRPEARPQTAGELARELNAAVNRVTSTPPSPAISAPAPIPGHSEPALLPAKPKFDRASAKAGSNSQRALLLVAALLLLVAGVSGGVWRYRQQSEGGSLASNNQIVPGGQQTSTLSGPPAEPDRSASNSDSVTPAATEPLSTGADLWEVIPDQTLSTTDAAFALGKADQQMASIKAGGQLALSYREGQFFGEGEGPDLRVYGPEQGQVSYTIFVRDNPAGDWQRVDINRKGFPQGMAGHDMGHHGVQQARQVMIRNNGDSDLNIDAATVVYKDKVSGESHSHGTPMKASAAGSGAAHQRSRLAPNRSGSAKQSAHLRKRRNSNT
ncbi:MAG: serine/threonine-protein kinase [Blastocatellia bacterium]